MAIHITRLNGGDITIGSSGGASGHPETRFTLEGGTVETANITGTLDSQWLVDNGYWDWDGTWLKTITQVDIGNTVTTIDYHTFFGCTSVTSVTIPNSVTSIGGDAFNGCGNLTIITVLGKTTAQAQTLLADAGVPGGCTIIGELG